MSNTAASGGYWIAAGADRIVAQPAHADRLDRRDRRQARARGGLAQAGRELGRGRPAAANADIWSINKPYSAEAQARVDALVGWLYDRFTKLVSDARDMPPDRVRELARGRVWAGETAAALGLVDELGGFDVALAAVRKSLQLPPDAPLDDRGPAGGGQSAAAVACAR